MNQAKLFQIGRAMAGDISYANTRDGPKRPISEGGGARGGGGGGGSDDVEAWGEER
jgi:hypothetical protein